jgi:hypothetical protein
MSLNFVTDVANTGAAKLSPAIRADPATAAIFLNCIFIPPYAVFFYFAFVAR